MHAFTRDITELCYLVIAHATKTLYLWCVLHIISIKYDIFIIFQIFTFFTYNLHSLYIHIHGSYVRSLSWSIVELCAWVFWSRVQTQVLELIPSPSYKSILFTVKTCNLMKCPEVYLCKDNANIRILPSTYLRRIESNYDSLISIT